MIARSVSRKALCGISAIGLLLSGCAQTPLGPTVQVMPGQGKSFDTFQADQANCKGYAADQVRGQADASNQRAVGAALLTTALGAGLGAAAGGFSGAAGSGAAIGAAGGSVVGAGIGAQNSSNDQLNIQQQYDNAFAQCMYAKGEMVPGFTPIVAAPAPRVATGPDPVLVRGTQTELIRLHYLNDTADGAMGPRTSAAIRTYQQASGLPADGSVSQSLLARLQSTPSSAGVAPASAPATAQAPGWVAPTTQGQTAGATPVSAPAAPSGWVAPKTQTP
jgi:hypothetical protein